MARPPDPDPSDAHRDHADRPLPNRRSEDPTPLPLRVTRTRGPLAWLDLERLFGAAKTLAWLAPLTVLIWIYAEREQTVSPWDGDVPVRITCGNPDLAVEYDGATQQPTVDLKLNGPQEGVRRVTEQLQAQHGLLIDTQATLAPGQAQKLNVVDYVQILPLFRAAGVTVLESRPATLLVNVEQMSGDVQATVEVDPRVTTLAAPAVFTPAHVTLRGPMSRVALEDGPDGRPRVYVDLSKVDGLQRPGEHAAASVPVVLPVADDRVQVRPAVVAVKLQVRAADVTYVIPKVPVAVCAPPDMLRQFDVAANNGDPTLANVTVTGPQRQVDLLQSRGGPFAPTAELDVSPADFNREEPRRLRYSLPDGLRPSPDDVARAIDFKLTRRDANPGG